MPLVAKYYAQRACVPGTLLITETTLISPRASGNAHVPGMWSDEQIEAWAKVTQAVQNNGSYIFCQLWALGRAAELKVLKEESQRYVSSSPVPMPGTSGTEYGATGDDVPAPEALNEEEIQAYIQDFAEAAKSAIKAGFNGVEIRGANGYLVDQFNQDTCNIRTDKWGGSIENRRRFALEVPKAVVDAVSPDRTAMRLSPFSTFQGMHMKDPVPQLSHIIQGLKHLKLACLHVVESRIAGNADVEKTEGIDFAVDIWKQGPDPSPLLAAGGFKPASARTAVEEERRDADVCIVFGRPFLATPDLVYRVKHGIELTRHDRNTFYTVMGKDGFIDYPFSNEFLAAAPKFAKV